MSNSLQIIKKVIKPKGCDGEEAVSYTVYLVTAEGAKAALQTFEGHNARGGIRYAPFVRLDAEEYALSLKAVANGIVWVE